MMEQAIRAIETHYKGYRFRSRLEARWAVFFDSVGIEYQYEPQGFEKDNIRFLPDFLLPKSRTWVEVKGTDDAISAESGSLEWILDYGSPLPWFDDSANRNVLHSYPTEASGLLILGDIPEPIYGLHFHRIVQHYKGLHFNWAFFSSRGPEVMIDRLLDFFRPDPLEPAWTTRSRFVPTVTGWSEVIDAYKAARSARFEHGESPKGI